MKIFKKINWYALVVALLISVLLTIVYCFLTKSIKLFINVFLSMTTLPSLFVSFAVFNNLSDVKKQIDSENRRKDFYDRRKKQELNFFADSYKNRFKTNSTSLKNDLTKVVLDETEFSDDFMKRIQKLSHACNEDISSYTYIENWFSLDREDKVSVTGSSDFDFDQNLLEDLKSNLQNFYTDRAKIREKQTCEISVGLLIKFEKLCEYLIQDALGEDFLIDRGSDKDLKQEEQVSDAGGDFFG